MFPIETPKSTLIAEKRKIMTTVDETPTPNFQRASLESNLNGVVQHPSISLPLAFRLYCKKIRATYWVFYIGRNKSEQLNAVSVTYTRWTHAVVTLHDGPTVDSPVLGSSVHNGKSIDIALRNGRVQMTGRSSHGSLFTFTLPVGTDGREECFEWRRSRGGEVKSLGGRGGGWELIRTNKPDTHREEVVAIFSADLFLPKLSGRFEFLGSGATDEMGGNWAVTAVITALSLGQKQRDTATMTMGLVTR